MGLNDNAVRNRSLHSMGLFLVVAFVMAWVLWLVGWLINQHKLSLPLFPVLVVGSFGPFVGALVATMTEGGPRHALRFFARAFDLRMGWAVFLVSFFLLPILAVIVELAHAKFTHGAPHFTMTLSEAPLNYLFLFLIGGTLAEEYGWSLLSDKLDGVLPLKGLDLRARRHLGSVACAAVPHRHAGRHSGLHALLYIPDGDRRHAVPVRLGLSPRRQ
jgi:hypothetical protein